MPDELWVEVHDIVQEAVRKTGVGGRRDLRTPQPTPQAPRARTHALPVIPQRHRAVPAPGERPLGPWVTAGGRRREPEGGPLPCSSVGKESAFNAGDPSLIPR